MSPTASKTEKPWFVIHIGPPKTAASAIQESLIENSHSLSQLDNFYILGGGGWKRSWGSPMPNGELLPCLRCIVRCLEGYYNESHQDVQYFRSHIQHHRQLGHHLIFSAEMLGSWLHYDWDKFESLFCLHDFRLRIVLTYRHLVDWIPSIYYQAQHLVAQDYHGILPFVEERLHKIIAKNFGAGGSLEDFQGEGFKQYLMIWHLYQQWSSKYGNVTVWDYHGSSSDGGTDWICHMLPETTQTCDVLTQSKTKLQKVVDSNSTLNISATTKYQQPPPLHVNRVVAHVRTPLVERSMIIGSRTDRFSVYERNIFFRKIHRMMERYGVLEEPVTNSTFFKCISVETEAMLLNTSLTLMDLMYRILGKTLSDSEREHAVEMHNAVYEKAKHDGRYCDIRPELVLSRFPNIKTSIGKRVNLFRLDSPTSSVSLSVMALAKSARR